MKQLLALGKISEDAQAAFDYLGRYFGMQTYEYGVDSAGGVIAAMKPNLLLVSLEDLLVSPAMTLSKLREENPRIAIVTFGTVKDKVKFEQDYPEEHLENLNIPFEEDLALQMVCKILKMNPDTLKQQMAARKKILVVDDDATTLRSIRSMLEDQFEVAVANSGPKAFEQMKETLPDVVLLDYEMPEMSGREVLVKIRQTPEWMRLPVVFITSNSGKEIIQELIKLKASGLLLKPIIMGNLVAAIEKALKGK
ncbi:MAG: response regulator [Lachnospiraceae bacterium]|nr:response regulator [Lachnospiraceae bacterium]